MKSPTKSLPKPSRKQRVAVGQIMWSNPGDDFSGGIVMYLNRLAADKCNDPAESRQYLLLDLTDKEAYERAVRAIAWALCGAESNATAEQAQSVINVLPPRWHLLARASLSAIGWSAPAAGKTGKEGAK